MDFSIEKPLPISINSDLLVNINEDTRWVSQLKIDEHRSFLIVKGNTLTVLGWRGNVHHVFTLEEESKHELIFDGGIIKTTIFKSKPMLYAFDILVIDGVKQHTTYADRYDLLNKYKLPLFTVPVNLTNPIKQYNDLLNKQSQYIDEFAKSLNISTKEAYNICEGLVIKNATGKLSFSRSLVKTSNQLKLKLPNK